MAENRGRRTANQRIVLVPAPFQGHVTPMMQLATILHSKGFSITVAQTRFSSSSLSENYPDFHFLPIPSNFEESELKVLGLVAFVLRLNDACEVSFKESLIKFLQQQKNTGDRISSIVYDEYMYFSEAAAKHLKLPSFIFRTTNAITVVSRSLLVKLSTAGCSTSSTELKSQDELVTGLFPLRFRDLPTSAFGTLNNLQQVYGNISKRGTYSAVILNSVVCLESSSLSLLTQECQAPVYAIGPLHRVATTASTSLIEEQRGCIDWLHKQKPGSVLYISQGSLALMKNKEVLEMAWGLASSEQHFLWVIRPGSIPGSEWIETLPEEFKGWVSKRGYIVKWAPQKEVLAHKAVGGFWSHCGWNSTLESISNGKPMICRPFSGDQKVNARYLSHVWRIGIQVEGELEREDIRRAVRRLMVEQEGEEMKKRAMGLKQKVDASATEGGSSKRSLDELVDLIRSF